MTLSLVADELIAKAEECYALGLIDERRLDLVTERALREPGYNAILDLPLSFELDHARELAAAAARREKKRARRARLRRILGVS